MIRRETQAIIIAVVVLGLGLIYVGHQISIVQNDVSELENTTGILTQALQGMHETLQTRVSELENLIIECEVTIDNGTAVTTETVYLTRGATGLDALQRIAVVETTYYAGLGGFIDSINGLANDPEAKKYWMWYTLDNKWELAPVGVGNYELKDGDNIKFSYETQTY